MSLAARSSIRAHAGTEADRRRLSRLNAPAPNATTCRRPPVIARFFMKWIIWFWSAKLLWNSTAAASVIVANRAFEFGNGVHDEGAVADDGRIKRIAADQQQFAVLLHCYLQRVPGRKAGKLPRLDDLVVNCDLARHDIERKFSSTRRMTAQCAAGYQTGVNHEGTAGCPNGTGDIADLSCNEAHRSV